MRHHVTELAVHHGAGLGDGAGVAAREPHHLQAVPNRGQGFPEFVGEERDEVVLPAVGLLERSSARFRSVMSWDSPRMPTILPAASLTGVTRESIQTREPSLR